MEREYISFPCVSSSRSAGWEEQWPSGPCSGCGALVARTPTSLIGGLLLPPVPPPRWSETYRRTSSLILSAAPATASGYSAGEDSGRRRPGGTASPRDDGARRE